MRESESVLSRLSREGRTDLRLPGDELFRVGRMSRTLYAADYADACALIDVIPLGTYVVEGVAIEIGWDFEGRHAFGCPELWCDDSVDDETYWSMKRAVANRIAAMPEVRQRLAELEAEMIAEDEACRAARAPVCVQ